MMREEVSRVGELILLFVVAVYFCYGFYALNRESGWQLMNKLRDFSRSLTLGLKQAPPRTIKRKKLGLILRKNRNKGE